MAKEQKEDIQTVRIPVLGESLARGTSSSLDQRFTNGYFDVLKNSISNKVSFFFNKRPGMVQSSQPTGSSAVGRGAFTWRGSIYSCMGTQLYKGTTNLGVTLTTSTGAVSFEETRASATTPLLSVSDGISLYVIDTSDGVTVLNNVAITSSSIANPSVITAPSHGLTTGNKIVIRNHTGSTPTINGTVYTVTVTGANTFTIPVNVTTGGTGGTIGVFPSPNLVKILYFDGYQFVFKTDGSLCNCDLDDPRLWDPTKFIVPIMESSSPIGIARQTNFLITFMNTSTQAFFNNANATGSPLNNYDQAMLQVGCAARETIVQEESFVTWVGSAASGGLTVFRLAGLTQIKDIGDPTLNRILNAEGTSITSARAQMIRSCGHAFYILTLTSSNRTFVYDYDTELWCEWTGTDGNRVPIQEYFQYNNTLLGLHETNGKIYQITPTIYQDDGTNFAVGGRFSRVDFDTTNRKFIRSVELLGDKQSSSAPVSVQYSDDDYNTLSTARTFDMSDTRSYHTAFGNFRRRSWQFSYSGNTPLRLEALQLKFRLGSD